MKYLGYLFVLGVISLGCWFLFEVLREMLRLYGEAENDLKLAVITAFGSAMAFVINNAIQSSRERKARLFEAKREAYSGFFRSFMSFLHGAAAGQEPNQNDMVEAIQALSTDVMTWGSAATVNAFNQYQRLNAQPTQDQQELFRRTENFLRALRKDLGHSDAALEHLALTKLNLRGDEHANLG